jgi:regulatory protein
MVDENDCPLGEEAPLERALTLALGYLNQRERTEAEVRAHLTRKGLRDNERERAIRTLTEQGYLDDARFARAFTEDKRALEDWGTERIRRALLTRGIDRELAEVVLARDGHAEELTRALTLLERRFPAPPDDRREWERALGVLLRKGYDGDVALDALRAHGASREFP